MSPSQANYVLIDGVLRPDAIAQLYQRCESLNISPLYTHTRWQALQDLGPILVSARSASKLIDETVQSALLQADASLLYSQAPMQQVADHLRRFIERTDVLGGKCLLRFADPLVTRHWLGSYQGQHLDNILGPVDAWHVPETPHSWEPSTMAGWCSFVRTAAVPEWFEAPLGQRQLDALDRAGRWRFVAQLHQHFERHYPAQLSRMDVSGRTQWFNERLDEADIWGLVSERSLAVWIKYSLLWGEGFTLQPHGPYPDWLARTPPAAKLAPELRIQQMDNDCAGIDNYKDIQ